jgi:hypothetical protein
MHSKWLGLFALALSGLILFVWIPFDIDTGILEKARRSVVLGDSFAPAVAASLIAIGGVLLFVEKHSVGADSQPMLSRANMSYLLTTLLIIAVALLLMRYAGPVALAVFGDDEANYRLLRDTAPWKYIGFVVGGVFLINALITLIERRFRFRFLVIGIVAVLVLIAIYDLPFDDLLLPPNGDV